MRYGISAAGIVVEDDEVLMVHHVGPGYDFWTLPGGLEGNESVFDCAKRELAEETGPAVELEVSGSTPVCPLILTPPTNHMLSYLPEPLSI